MKSSKRKKITKETRKKIEFKNKYIISLLLILVVAIFSFTYFKKCNAPPITESKITGKKINLTTKNKSKISDKSNSNLNIQLSENEQNKVMTNNKNNMKEFLNKGIPYVISEKYNVYIPVYSYTTKSQEEQLLAKGGVTYPQYGSPEEGNFIVFAHNSQVRNAYFSPFVDNLYPSDIIKVKYKKGNYIYTNTYKITSREVVNYKDVDEVYYTTEKQTITLGACKIPYDTPDRIIWKGELINTNKGRYKN